VKSQLLHGLYPPLPSGIKSIPDATTTAIIRLPSCVTTTTTTIIATIIIRRLPS